MGTVVIFYEQLDSDVYQSVDLLGSIASSRLCVHMYPSVDQSFTSWVGLGAPRLGQVCPDLAQTWPWIGEGKLVTSLERSRQGQVWTWAKREPRRFLGLELSCLSRLAPLGHEANMFKWASFLGYLRQHV
ncbi:hypothetical protein PIB30_009218 [Stylosanthes scabra]|uniref:Uncharacterized protein n=1 Tax=Stylosanthes scabra TaxID=79078 RepID=A0ABU6Q5W5_9FABA|nr:hypothetical protein [Stylosanthes scabra]